MEDSSMSYAEAIKKLRNKMILTQTEFAELIGVTFGTVNRWESGKYKPTTKLKRKLAPLFEKYNIEVE
ncbi:helix-turn-helix domain-containing protein [Mycoplasmopsis arginini]|uniref:helix-turn-helix domain-containing protein n=1 Tax=Mycoplasmopsis arginini TaxID=2094 RepID=UPI00249DEE6D|nr:helix-turn-helix transcriptional regulator [Mycoplasmopsis arginini]